MLVSAGLPVSANAINKDVSVHTKVSLNVRHRVVSPARVLALFTVVMCTHPFAKKALTLHLARSEGHERYFICNLMHRKVLASSHQHLMAEAPLGQPNRCSPNSPYRPKDQMQNVPM